jgi:bifunctional ADP-heptose synthase (sugar kinase/adenylyltransferase)
MRNLLIKKYEQELKNLIVMDDYDGGKAQAYREVINDLKKFKGSSSIDEKSIKSNTHKSNKN